MNGQMQVAQGSSTLAKHAPCTCVVININHMALITIRLLSVDQASVSCNTDLYISL